MIIKIGTGTPMSQSSGSDSFPLTEGLGLVFMCGVVAMVLSFYAILLSTAPQQEDKDGRANNRNDN
jgi:xanthine/uracil/vitamin C permease (AzgA family)